MNFGTNKFRLLYKNYIYTNNEQKIQQNNKKIQMLSKQTDKCKPITKLIQWKLQWK